MNAKTFVTSCLAVALLTGSVYAAEGNDPQAAPEKQAAASSKKAVNDCIFSRSINDWRVLDNHTMIVYAPNRNNPYLVELTRPAHSLDFEVQLGFEDRNRDERFCSYGGDSIVVSGPVSDRISIRSIRKLESDEAKLMIAQAKEAKDAKGEEAKMPPPEDMKSEKEPEQKPQ